MQRNNIGVLVYNQAKGITVNFNLQGKFWFTLPRWLYKVSYWLPLWWFGTISVELSPIYLHFIKSSVLFVSIFLPEFSVLLTLEQRQPQVGGVLLCLVPSQTQHPQPSQVQHGHQSLMVESMVGIPVLSSFWFKNQKDNHDLFSSCSFWWLKLEGDVQAMLYCLCRCHIVGCPTSYIDQSWLCCLVLGLEWKSIAFHLGQIN